MSTFVQLNDLLALGTLLIDLEKSNDEEILAKHRRSKASYSIAQMSDGERNAAIIGATVLTVDPGTVLLIDEPERHLHRSIIVPFLAALFAKREDCTFIISTHELALPAANPAAGVLMVRSCEWKGNRVEGWDIDLLGPNAQLPEDLRLAILGSRRKVLFFEGTGTSLDLPIYNALFPDISVVAVGTSTDVQRAVEGMRGSQNLHHVEAYGLIDRDGHSQEKVKSLLRRIPGCSGPPAGRVPRARPRHNQRIGTTGCLRCPRREWACRKDGCQTLRTSCQGSDNFAGSGLEDHQGPSTLRLPNLAQISLPR